MEAFNVIMLLLSVCCQLLYAQEYTLTPVWDERTKLYGFKDWNNNIIVDYMYEDYTIQGDLIGVIRQSKVGFINNQGTEVIPCNYDYGNTISPKEKTWDVYLFLVEKIARD